MDDTLAQLASFASSLGFDDLPPEAVHDVKRHVLDSLGCGIGAFREVPPTIARNYAEGATTSTGATILGTRHRTTAELATLANGLAIRYFDFNDTNMAVDGGHSSDNIAAVIAVAEQSGATAREAIAGIVVAYEVQDRLSDACGLYPRGWDHVTYVAMSAAAGAGSVLGLGHEAMGDAIAISAVSNAAMGSIRAGTISMWKAGATANAARSGVLAAMLAAKGMTGPAEAFEGKHGFIEQLTSGRIRPLVFGGEGRRYKVQDSKFKMWPGDYECQGAIEPAFEIHRELEGQVDGIASVTIDAYDYAVDCTAASPERWRPTTRETADHSLPFMVALCLFRGDLWLDDYLPASFENPRLVDLMRKIEVRRDSEFSSFYPEENRFRLTVRTLDGQEFVRESRFPLGHPSNNVGDNELEAKFRRLAQPFLPDSRINEVLATIWGLENAAVGDLMAQLTVDA